jgi:hypothetical protein
MNRRLLVQILLPFVLLTQVAAGFSPGRSLCVMFEACCGRHVHVEGASHSHGDCNDHDHDHDHHGPCEDSCEESCDGSTCHLHVSLPDDTEMPRERIAGAPLVETVAWPSTLPAPCVPEMPEPAEFPRWDPPPDAWPSCGQRKAIETDSLLI